VSCGLEWPHGPTSDMRAFNTTVVVIINIAIYYRNYFNYCVLSNAGGDYSE
jgi:hypothetical protein